MAFSSANISSDEQDGYDKDCPLLVGKNELSSSVVSHKAFSPSSANPTTATDRSNEFMPIQRIYDGRLDLVCAMSSHYAFTTVASSLTDSAWLSLKFSSALSFDTLILAGHNAASDKLAVSTVVSDSDNIASSFTTIAGSASISYQTTATDQRIAVTNLVNGSTTNPQLFSGVERLAVRWRTENEFFAPRLGELILGKRRQLQHRPEFPWNDQDYQSSVSDFETTSGNKVRYGLSKSQSIRTVTLTISSSVEMTAIQNWWVDCNYGKDSFWWIETPKTDPRAFLMKAVNARLDFPQTIGSEARILKIDMIEQKPYWGSERYVD